MVLKNKNSFLVKNKKNTFLTNTKTTIYNTLIVIDEIFNDDIGRNIVDFANYCVENNIGVVIFTRNLDIKLLLNEKNIFIESKSCNDKNLFFSNKILKICKEYKIDIIQVFSPELCKKIVLLKKKINIPVVSQIFNIFDISNRLKFLQMKYTVKTDLIITLSNYVCNFLLNHFIFDVNNIKVFDIGVNDYIFNIKNVAPGRVKDVLNLEVGTDVCKKKIFYCHCDFNDIDICYKIFKAIRLVRLDNVVFVFSDNFEGTAKQRKFLLKKIDELNIQKNVKIIKPVLDKPAMYISSYAVIHVQKGDNSFTKTFCEAGFMKKPVIEICGDGVDDKIIDGKTGFIVKKNNVFDIKNAISKMIDLSNNDYKKMCENSYNYAIKYFQMNSIFSKINIEIYNCLKNFRNKLVTKTILEKNKISFLD